MTEGVRPNEKEVSGLTYGVEFGLHGDSVCFIRMVGGREFKSYRMLFDTLDALIEE
jgi:hypothetical protein